LQFLNTIDHQIFIFLNSYHNSWLDGFMLFITHKYASIPLYIFLVGFIINHYKKKSWVVIVALIAIVAISDALASQAMKPYFKRLRPCHEVGFAEKVVLVGNCGGDYGMASSHAANTFAVASFLIILFNKKYKWMWLLLPWTLLVSYSRIYLGVHFPGDVLAGFLVGFVVQMAAVGLIWRKLRP